MEIEFELAGSASAEAIAALSWTIWQAYYRPDILSDDEVSFFWQRAYAPDRLRADMAAGTRYAWICWAGRRIGFLSWRAEPDAGRLHLGKLYLEPAFHGHGCGAQALAWVRRRAVEQGLGEIYLYVFRQNARAIKAYERAGFVIARSEITDCGAGFRYDDYVMVCRLGAEAGGAAIVEGGQAPP